MLEVGSCPERLHGPRLCPLTAAQRTPWKSCCLRAGDPRVPAAIPNCRPRRMAHCCCLKPLRSGCLVPQQINGMLPLQTASYFSDSARFSPAPAQQLQPPLLPGLHRASLSLRAETRCPHTAVSDIGQVEFRLPVNQHRSHIRGQRLCPHLLQPQLKNSMPGVSPHSPPLLAAPVLPTECSSPTSHPTNSSTKTRMNVTFSCSL